ncbi:MULTISPECIES: LysE family translocator [unclassified Mesorhizobium]|uniref:LysE family translocator n=1 Tax=unclassified Mesorhizobium TaxID=325217 RepID=UPI001093EEF3|nr:MULTISPECIES: LysE family translocator [unclassified Mesorhizobium]TGT88588.1 LysE family translocator [Mesorhizobium sp. M8A.F.Ca.ET.161.01.1.1]TGV41888.1 LysE family translocator [Mesorhizobium sp. M8A.F.Ca.ET.142.01.1.1]TGW07902.1 LysE family translocator [Mesorhizobium sp. M2D.F.Ca.ET.145.01.1.1]
MDGSLLSQPEPWRQLLALLLAATVVMSSPGPATISVTAVGAAFGLRDSLRYTGGIVLGTIAVLLVVATGVMAVLGSMPKLAPLLVVASAAYILYLAFKIATAPALAARAAEASRPTWLAGFLLAVANPKAYVAIAAVFAGTSSRKGDVELGLWTKLTVLAVMIVVIHAVWLVAGAAFARFLRRPVASRIINLVFAATLLLTTVLAVYG